MMCLHGLHVYTSDPHTAVTASTHLGFTNHHRAVRSVAEEIDVAANAMKFRSVGRNQIDRSVGHSELLAIDLEHANHSLVGWIGCRALENLCPKMKSNRHFQIQ